MDRGSSRTLARTAKQTPLRCANIVFQTAEPPDRRIDENAYRRLARQPAADEAAITPVRRQIALIENNASERFVQNSHDQGILQGIVADVILNHRRTGMSSRTAGLRASDGASRKQSLCFHAGVPQGDRLLLPCRNMLAFCSQAILIITHQATRAFQAFREMQQLD